MKLWLRENALILALFLLLSTIGGLALRASNDAKAVADQNTVLAHQNRFLIRTLLEFADEGHEAELEGCQRNNQVRRDLARRTDGDAPPLPRVECRTVYPDALPTLDELLAAARRFAQERIEASE